METTTIHLHSGFTIGEVDPRIFGGFLEHMGRCVYEGVYEPASPHADEQGFRSDVTNALDRLRLPVVRYPGGNFASGYHWMDGIGPVADRPTVRELAWQSIEPNTFGTDEYMRLCRKLDWTPMLSVNLGTGTPEEARNWVEYCNAPKGTMYSDLRAKNGHPTPRHRGCCGSCRCRRKGRLRRGWCRTRDADSTGGRAPSWRVAASPSRRTPMFGH